MKALAIVDAGIGGLGTYSAIRAQSDIPIFYFSDSGFAPYGLVPKHQLRNRLKHVFDFLIDQGADKIVVACNAASTALPEQYHAQGIIRHGIKAIEGSGAHNIGLIGGSRTIRSQAYAKPIRAAGFNLKQRIAQPLSAHIESGNLNSNQLHIDLARILHPLKHSEAVLLACTHYPAIAEQIKLHLSPQTRLLDPAEILANWIIQHWTTKEYVNSDRWYTTGDKVKLVENGKRAFDVNITHPEEIIL